MHCPKCGCYLDIEEDTCYVCGFHLSKSHHQRSHRRKNNNTPWIIGLIFVLITSFIISKILDYDINIFFNDNDYIQDTTTDDPIEEYEPIIYDEERKIPSRTIIEYDHTYDYVALSSRKDAIDYIINDSVNQKGNCPKDIVQLEEKIIKDFDIKAINLCEMPPAYARDVYNDFYWLKNDYTKTFPYLDLVSVGNFARQEDNVVAKTVPFLFLNAEAANQSITMYPMVFRSEIVLNTLYYFNPTYFETMVNDSISLEHYPKNATPASIFIHEVAHFLTNRVILKKYGLTDYNYLYSYPDNEKFEKFRLDWNNNITTKEILDEAYLRDNEKGDLSFNQWRTTISGYAIAMNDYGVPLYSETIAEAFHDYFNNSSKAQSASRKIVEVLKEKL